MSRWPLWIGMSAGISASDWTGGHLDQHTAKIVIFMGIALFCHWCAEIAWARFMGAK